jgi:hypothetical protein
MERHENEPSGDQNHGGGDEKEKDINTKHLPARSRFGGGRRNSKLETNSKSKIQITETRAIGPRIKTKGTGPRFEFWSLRLKNLSPSLNMSFLSTIMFRAFSPEVGVPGSTPQ